VNQITERADCYCATVFLVALSVTEIRQLVMNVQMKRLEVPKGWNCLSKLKSFVAWIAALVSTKVWLIVLFSYSETVKSLVQFCDPVKQ